MAVRVRHAARALLVTPQQTILMMRFVTQDRSVWITPGGGLLGGEEVEAGLRRELREEIARTDWCVGPEVWTRSATFQLEGDTITQHERFFLVPTAHFVPPAIMPDAVERRWFGGFRWWAVREIQDSRERFAPRHIGLRLAELLDGGPPPVPIDVGR